MQYADETACLYANELLKDATADMTVAVVSAPSVFVAIKNLLVCYLSLDHLHLNFSGLSKCQTDSWLTGCTDC